MQAAQPDPTLEILLVEDNPADVTLIREGLREAKTKHHLSVAIDGDEAIRFLRREGGFASAPRPHLVLLDLNLPKRLGTEVLCAVKTDPNLKRIPILINTSSLAETDVNAAYECGSNSYIRKPNELADVYDIVRTLEHFWLELSLLPSTGPVQWSG